jgi:thymidine kinase
VENYRFELITGPMSCGKTEELLRRLKRALIANKKIKVFSPTIDTRVLADCIQSRNGTCRKAIKVKNALEILDHIEEVDEIIAIDELQFFDENIIKVIKNLAALGKKVIGTGLDLDFKEEPFGYMAHLLCYADKVDKLTAICMKCGSEYAVRTQRLIDGKPAEIDSPLIMIGGNETYEARCRNCYKIDNENYYKISDSEQKSVKNQISEYSFLNR